MHIGWVYVHNITIYITPLPGCAIPIALLPIFLTAWGVSNTSTRLCKHAPPRTRAQRPPPGFRRALCKQGPSPGHSPPAHAAGFYRTKEPESRVRRKKNASCNSNRTLKCTVAGVRVCALQGCVKWACTGGMRPVKHLSKRSCHLWQMLQRIFFF